MNKSSHVLLSFGGCILSPQPHFPVVSVYVSAGQKWVNVSREWKRKTCRKSVSSYLKKTIEGCLSDVPSKSAAFGGDNPESRDNLSQNFERKRKLGSEEELAALETLFLEGLLSYYEGTPMFSEEEFHTLRDELDHLGSTSTRLHNLEVMWVQASQQRDFDRNFQNEFELSQSEMKSLKEKLLEERKARPPLAEDLALATKRKIQQRSLVRRAARESEAALDNSLRYLLFGDATLDRFKLLVLYAPAALLAGIMSSFMAISFFLFDGEVEVRISAIGRLRFFLLLAVIVYGVGWFTNFVTPRILRYLDLGHPLLLKGHCPQCGSMVSCLFTSSETRIRDERVCSKCNALVGFNHRWRKVYLVRPSSSQTKMEPD
ncbi:uncharacterized protein Gasu_41960 [Galdieria sulphuraria]|uniref:Uncharacterized protein n=1 Tax=Galdieria sulphuraria TaxID=130081 RepID=M2XEH7_GALSU|nr:uncharacterized protein Gasu_41960 [Galdieria sulphuraria]EME28357.1 hypothetical protein Gasu_41960 [Galdieria sulphuraria]|eukprot:XP_005704877.1 hypothetical protein Gasu_41960 [Galdieria sulphuraria]